MTDFLNVPSFNVGNGPVSFSNFTPAPSPPSPSLGSIGLGATHTRKALAASSTQEKIVLAMGLGLTLFGAIGAYTNKEYRNSLSAIALTSLPLALAYAGFK
tara:strand:- start:761 stop:1063 length:303 start_codon:yes stop_codon:yes gene_type:complete